MGGGGGGLHRCWLEDCALDRGRTDAGGGYQPWYEGVSLRKYVGQNYL